MILPKDQLHCEVRLAFLTDDPRLPKLAKYIEFFNSYFQQIGENLHAILVHYTATHTHYISFYAPTRTLFDFWLISPVDKELENNTCISQSEININSLNQSGYYMYRSASTLKNYVYSSHNICMYFMSFFRINSHISLNRFNRLTFAEEK